MTLRYATGLLFAGLLYAQPQFQYPVTGRIADVLRSDEAFRPLAAQVRSNVEGVLRGQLDDNSVRRELLSTVMMLDLLEDKNDAARGRMDEIQALEPTPAAKALSNLTARAMLDASGAQRDSPAYRAAIFASIRGTLDALPFDAVRDEVKALKEKLELPVHEVQLVGQLSAALDPLIEKNGSLPSGLVHGLPGLRFGLTRELPVRAVLSEALGAYLAGHAGPGR
jgi:hypothetical protein